MKIVAETDGVTKEAYKVHGRAYKCFPRSTNTSKDAKEFEDVMEAAIFLLRNPTWGIRMNPGAAIIYDNIQILR